MPNTEPNIIIHDETFELRWFCRDGREGTVRQPRGFATETEAQDMAIADITEAGIVPDLSQMLFFTDEPFEGEVSWY